MYNPYDIRLVKTQVIFENNVGHEARAIRQEPDGPVTDYLDVKITGYLSTFPPYTEQDRMGDTVLPGAFAADLPEFAKNSIMLMDHQNRVAMVAGVFDIMREDERGLFVHGPLSNSPSPQNRDLRFKVAEGIIKGLSMSGYFFYLEDRVTIYRVRLFEGSIVAVPANQDALFVNRSLLPEELDRLIADVRSPQEIDQIESCVLAGRVVGPENRGKAMDIIGAARGRKLPSAPGPMFNTRGLHVGKLLVKR